MGSFFDSLRQSHPVKVGDVIDGKRVVLTCYAGLPAVPHYRLEGESALRKVPEVAPGPGEFRCAKCGGIFPDDVDEALALAKLFADFGNVDPADCEVVCDDCYAAIHPARN